jgi:chromosome segregation ATPase
LNALLEEQREEHAKIVAALQQKIEELEESQNSQTLEESPREFSREQNTQPNNVIVQYMNATLSGAHHLALDGDTEWMMTELSKISSQDDSLAELEVWVEKLYETIKSNAVKAREFEELSLSYKKEAENTKAVMESMKKQFIVNLQEESSRVASLRAELDDCRSDLSQLKSTLEASHQERDSLQAAYDSLAKETEQLKKKMLTSQKSCSDLEFSLAFEKQKSHEELAQVADVNEVLKNDIAHLQTERARLAQLLEDMKMSFSALEKEKSEETRQRHDLEQNEKTNIEKLSKLSHEHSQALLQIQSLDKSIQELSTHDAVLKEKIELLQNEKAAITSQVELLQKSLSNLEGVNLQLNERAKIQDSLCSELQNQITTKTLEFSTLLNENVKLKEMTNQLVQQLDSLEEKLLNEQRQLSVQLQGHRDETDQLKQSWSTVEQSLTQLVGLTELKKETKHIQMLLQQQDTKEKERNAEFERFFTLHVDKASKELIENQKSWAEREVELATIHAKLEAEISTLQASIEGTNANASKKISELAEKLAEKESEASADKTRLEVLKVEILALQATLAEEKIASSVLKEQNSTLVETIQEMKSKTFLLEETRINDTQAIRQLLSDLNGRNSTDGAKLHEIIQGLTNKLDSLVTISAENNHIQKLQLDNLTSTFSKDMQGLADKLSELKAVNYEQQAKINELEVSLSSEKFMCQSLNTELAELRETLESKINESKLAMIELEAVKKEAELQRSENVDLSMQLKSMDDLLKSLRADLANKDDELQKIHSVDRDASVSNAWATQDLKEKVSVQTKKMSELQNKNVLLESELMAERSLSETLLAELSYINEKGQSLRKTPQEDSSQTLQTVDELQYEEAQAAALDLQRQNAANKAILKAQLHNSTRTISKLEYTVKLLSEQNETLIFESERIRAASSEIMRHILRIAEALEFSTKDTKITVETFDWIVARVQELQDQNKTLSYKSSQLEQLMQLSLDQGKRLEVEKVTELAKKDEIIRRLQHALDDSASAVGRKRLQHIVSKHFILNSKSGKSQ